MLTDALNTAGVFVHLSLNGKVFSSSFSNLLSRQPYICESYLTHQISKIYIEDSIHYIEFNSRVYFSYKL